MPSYARYNGLSGGGGGGGPVTIYPGISSFPVTAQMGSIAIDASTGNGYEFNGTSWVLVFGPSSALSLGNLDAQTGNSKGASLLSGILSMQSASLTVPGLVNNTTQSFSGNKTLIGKTTFNGNSTTDVALTILGFPSQTSNVFEIYDQFGARHLFIDMNGKISTNGDIVGNGMRINGLDYPNTIFNSGNPISITTTAGNGLALDTSGNGVFTGTVTGSNLSGTNTGDLTLGTANGLSLSAQVLSLGTASTSTTGALTSTDWTIFNNKGSGTVTDVSVASANGFDGSSSGGATPAITISTSVTGVLKGNGTAISAAAAGTDYSVGTSALSTGILKSTTSTGALSIAIASDFPTLNQNTSGNAATVTTNANLTGPITSVGNATSVTNNAITLAMMAQAPTLTLQGNNTGGTANVLNLTASQVNSMLGSISNPMTTLGDSIYGGASGVVTRLAGNTTTASQYLSQTGTGSASAAPVWASFKYPTQQLFSSNGTVTGRILGVSSANATVGAVYSLSGFNYTVQQTISGGTTLYVSGGTALSSGTLTKSSGTGDTTITVTSFISNTATYTPTSSSVLYIKVRGVGQGGGGGGSGVTASGGSGGGGTATYFGAGIAVANSGGGGNTYDVGGAGGGGGGTLNLSLCSGIVIQGGGGQPGMFANNASGGSSGLNPLFGGGIGGGTGSGSAGVSYGSGGGGAGTNGTSNSTGGGGGGAGGFDIIVPYASSFPYFIATGAGGGGTAGTSGNPGGQAQGGYLEITEFYQ